MKPDDLVELLTGARPRSGICIDCKQPLKPGIDTDHSFCNSCWDQIVAHPYDYWIDTEGVEGCGLCDEPKDAPIHTKQEAE